MSYEPIVKWSGSKRSQAAEIVSRMPKEIATYYEPFCGGCSVLYRLLQTPSIKVNKYVASDVNQSLIGLWTMIKECPYELIDGYTRMWKEFNGDPYSEERLYQQSTTELYSQRKEYFAKVRERFNDKHSAIDFLFIMRTTTNGMPRYNEKGEFNNSCHFSRPGINPESLRKICLEWSSILKSKNVNFVCQSYEDINPNSEDIVYLDSPYAETKGMYYGGIDLDNYFKWVGSLPCKWIMLFDGISGNEDLTYEVPKYLYVKHEYLHSGNSSFRRVIGKNRHADVKESLYMNFIPHDNVQQTYCQPSLF